jgi:hypothetical protein
MESAANERHSKYEYVLLSEYPDINTFHERVAVGSFSWTTGKSMQRILLKHNVFDHLVQGIPQTPPELARDYLDAAYPRRLRASGEQARAYEQDRFAPLYYRPMVTKRGAYVDLRGAFWWIMSMVGWNVDYNPGKFLSPGRAPYDFPLPNHKLARNCLVTAGLPNKLTVWTGRKFTEQASYNLHLNRGLYAVIMDILHMLAFAAVNLGAKYVNTDGYIIDDKQLPYLLGYLDRFRAPYHIKAEGETCVTGVGSYRVGDYTTKHMHSEFTSPSSNLVRPDNQSMLELTFLSICRDRVDNPDRYMR